MIQTNLEEMVARETKLRETKDELSEALREATETKDVASTLRDLMDPQDTPALDGPFLTGCLCLQAVLEAESIRSEWSGYSEKLHDAQTTVRCVLIREQSRGVQLKAMHA